jgi:hypothetical protein
MSAVFMESAAPSVVTSKRRLRAGVIVSALPVLFLLFDSVIKLLKIGPVVEAFSRMGIPDGLARGIGLLELACVIAYVIPRTAFFGLVLLTGFLGGAVALHVRLTDPLFSHTLFPVYMGALLWTGLCLRRPALLKLIAS